MVFKYEVSLIIKDMHRTVTKRCYYCVYILEWLFFHDIFSILKIAIQAIDAVQRPFRKNRALPCPVYQKYPLLRIVIDLNFHFIFINRQWIQRGTTNT